MRSYRALPKMEKDKARGVLQGLIDTTRFEVANGSLPLGVGLGTSSTVDDLQASDVGIEDLLAKISLEPSAPEPHMATSTTILPVDLSDYNTIPADSATFITSRKLPTSALRTEEMTTTPPTYQTTAQVVESLTNLYQSFRYSHSFASTLLSPAATKSIEVEADPKLHAMSKTQLQIQEAESAIWMSIPQEIPESDTLSTLDEELKLNVLAEQSILLKDSYERRMKPPTEQTYDQCKMIIKALGVPCLESEVPYEAEALAASLVVGGYADYVASEDTVCLFSVIFLPLLP